MSIGYTDTYYENTIGVSVLERERPQDILFKVDRKNAPYIDTKPFHPSQKIVEEHPDGSITFSMLVHHNYELERLLLGFGESLEVLAPRLLRRNMKRKLEKAVGLYK